MKNMENKDKNEFSIDTIIGFCRKNIRYISAGVIFLLLVIILVKYTGSNGNGDKESQVSVSAEAETQKETEAYEVDAYPEINELVENYYTAYAKGKTKKLVKYASPMSDIEKSYIKVFSDFVTSYKNITCYTKNGLTKDSHIVSVYYEMEFDGVDTLAPGLDFFYVEKNEDGDYYINNVYSQYNLTNHEYELDEDVQKLIAEFEQEEDVVALQKDVQTKYDEAVSADKKLKKMVNTTIQDAISEWVASLTGDDQAEETAKAEDADQTDESKTEDTEKEDSDKKEDTEKKEDTKKEDTEKKDDTDKTEDTKKEDTEKKDDTAKEDTEKKEETPQATSETVYTTSKVNVREQPNESANILAEVEASTQFTRTGTTEDGWSMIDYNGTTAYIKSDFLTTDPASITPTVTYIPEGTVVRLAEAVVVRSGIGENTDKVGTAFAGEQLTVVMSYAEGWTKVNWNGKEGYVKTEVID